jgi:hypothetical protein
MALKVPKKSKLSAPLEGDDADRLVEYMDNPERPDGHSEYLKSADQSFAVAYSPEPANAVFDSASR